MIGFPPVSSAAVQAVRATAPFVEPPKPSFDGPRPIVGLVGRKRSGKDTVAARLVSEFGFARYAFADPLKSTMVDLDPLIKLANGRYGRLSELVASRGWEAAKENPEVRRLLQAHGVAIRTHLNPSIWVNHALEKIAAETRPVVVTDVRFPNEADAIEAVGGSLVRLHRDGLPDDHHISETALADRQCRWDLYNEGNLRDLYAATGDLAGRVLGWWE